MIVAFDYNRGEPRAKGRVQSAGAGDCIDCGACEPECPVTAIFPEEDVPANMKQFVQINREVFKGENPPGRPNR